jgi:2-keto-4-pentenoate hydratase
MTPEQAGAAAALLHEARVSATPLVALPGDCRPRDTEDGRTIQEAWVASAGWEIAGYKIGCTSEHAQEMLGTDSPFPGRVFRPFVFDSPATVTAGPGGMIAVMVEGEFAFRLAGDLPARGTPYDRAEVEAAVAAVMPAIELVDTRFTDFVGVGVASLVADCGANGGLVLGAPVEDWRGIDLAANPVSMTVAGELRASGVGADALGHPLNALTWLANDLSRRGFGLEAGQVVTTGTCTQVFPVPPGETAVADHGPLGRVEVTLAA